MIFLASTGRGTGQLGLERELFNRLFQMERSKDSILLPSDLGLLACALMILKPACHEKGR